MRLGNHIRRCRFNHNEMSQEELAKAVGVTRQTIFSIEKGKYAPSTLLALKLARFFGKSVEEIFYIIEDEENKGGKE
ncbi:MAG: helix-turn-helix transcriptional regulator [Candidatus Aminicenantes bacterium]